MAGKLSEIQIAPGVNVIYQGKQCLIRRILDLTTVMLEDSESGKILRAEIKDLHDIPLEINSDESIKKNELDLSIISEKNWKEAQRRLAIIQPIIKSKGDGDLVAKLAKSNSVHIATIYRWIEKYEETGLLSSLLPKEKGNKGVGRLTDEIEEVIKYSIEDIFLSKQRSSIQKVCREVVARCQNAGITPPHPNTIRQRINSISDETRLKYRHSKYSSQEKYEPIKGSFPGADYPLSVVQIDHTKVDVFLVDEIHRKSLGRPWITVAIDVYSRMVVGFYVSFDPPGALGTGMCVSNSILPKELLMSKYDVPGSWPCWGIMRSIHVDNAKEFRGAMLQRVCEQYNIELNWRPVKKPHWGGHIERLIGTLMKESHDLPGTTFSNTKERKEYDSEKKAALTIKEFEKWLITFITNVYHNRIHKSLGMSPLQKYTEGIFGKGEQKGTGLPKRILDDRKIKLDFLPYEERSIQEYGVVIDHIHYYHDVLRKWIHAIEPGSGKSKLKKKFIFKRDPRDISHVYFYDPEAKQYYEIPYRDTSKPPITIWEFRAVLNLLKDQNQNPDEQKIFEAYEEMKRIEEKAITKTKNVKRNKKEIKALTSLQNSVRNELKSRSQVLDDKEVLSNINIDIKNIKPFEELENGTSK
jgi:putative transposase